MSLKETQEELKKQLAEAIEAESNIDPDMEESNEDTEKTDEVVEEPVEEKVQEVQQDLQKTEEKTEKEELTPSEHRRLRIAERDRKAAEKRAAEAEERLAKLEQQKAADPEPETQVELPPEVAELVHDSRKQKAIQEFVAIEENFKKNVDDYDDVAQQYAGRLFNSIKTLHPRLSDAEVGQKVKDEIIQRAANYFKDGYDPAEELYNEAKSLGISARIMEQEEKIEEVKKPDLNRVAQNKQRSSGMAAAKGQGGSSIMTKRYAAENLTNAEWARLSKDEKQRILSQ
jgi:hypothetical protein